jgi:hypothetical protein
VPLPLIGSIYPIARGAGTSAQDTTSAEYRKMRDALPNAFLFGLTGTPINRFDKNTFYAFGADEDAKGYMSRYGFEESIRDGATLKLHFEPRLLDLRIDKAAMIAVMHDEADFSELFMAYLLTRNSRIEGDLIDQLFNSSEKRLARLLLLLANFGKEGRPEPIIGSFSQETLAEMIGTTRSRVSFFMNKFRKLGYIKYNGKLEIHNSLLNVVLYDKSEIKTRNASEEP